MAGTERARTRGVLRRGEPMSRHTVWGVGGEAETYFEPADLDDLVRFLGDLDDDTPLTWVGLGSNLLVRDGGIEGIVIVTSGALEELAVVEPHTVRAEAGVACPKLARFGRDRGLCGCEFFAGIPGTVGGALAMNAGAFGGETWPLVRRVETVDRRGTVRVRGPADFAVGYRTVIGPEDEWFVAAEFTLSPGDPQEAAERVRALLRRRAETQPLGQRSCGSVFRNPDGGHAARLIEACGLKGTRVGAAAVSGKHANFIINEGRARAADIEALIDHVARVVEREQGVRLAPEVRIVGRPLADPAPREGSD